ncbi:hypothetical protein GOP47_0029250 [Adiantum capillus-veneris]|nr:hypothetical protein GOP47_0029250 [Adiantum capillus-veneris]
MGEAPLRWQWNKEPLLRSSPHKRQSLSLLSLVFLIFYEVSGGPFGIEDSVQAGGPLLAIIGFCVFPFIWSIPEAFITAELGTMFPENGGYVVWIQEAFGPFWGFQQGWWKWLSGVIDNALYPVLFLDYLKAFVPAVASGPVRVMAVIVLTAALTYLNYRGLAIVGNIAVCLGIFSLLPFLVMALCAIPKLNPTRWFAIDFATVDWTTYLNTLFWNLNYWDSVSTLVEEVDNVERTLPKALLYALVLVMGGYIVPLLAGTGATNVVRSDWSDGYFANIAMGLGGAWLGWWMEIAAAMSNMGLFEAEMSSDSFQLLGMAEGGMLPRVFATRSAHGTPSFGILASASAFLWLRKFKGDKHRPYKIPIGFMACVLMCIPPTVLIILVMVISTLKVVIISFVVAFIGFLLYPCIEYVKRKEWIQFSTGKEEDKALMHQERG